MNEMQDYEAVRINHDHACWSIILSGFLEVTGKEASQFLHGQITTDVLAQEDRTSVNACLLNNTGHLVSILVIHRFRVDKFWIETPFKTEEMVKNTLNRFIVRERVAIKSITSEIHATMLIANDVGIGSNPDKWISPTDTEDLSADDDDNSVVRRHDRYPPAMGLDFISRSDGVSFRGESEILKLSEFTMHILRVESAIPAWGAELTEKIIPLEAGLDSYISFTKGCYMGQEIIARIKSRGHTNWQLVKLKLSDELEVGAELWNDGKVESGSPHLRITSVANSPNEGWIGLGYVRAEHADVNTTFIAVNHEIVATIDQIVKVV